MITTRPYRKAMSVGHALAELQRCAGTQFDPDVVEALCAKALTPVPAPQTQAQTAAA